MTADLTGRRAIVSGGSSGIGLWIAHELALAGADVGLIARDRARLETAADLIGGRAGREILTASADVADGPAIRSAVEGTIDRLGGLDVLVNTAATPAGGIANLPLTELDPEYALAEVDVKAIGYLRTIVAAAPALVAGGDGRIVNVAGLSVLQTGNLIASLRNAGVVALSKNVADELGPSGVSTSVIHPGLTLTGPPTGVSDEEDDRVIAAALEVDGGLGGGADNDLGRLVHAREIGRLVVLLASDAGRILNGESFHLGTPRGVVTSI
jgi:NAD(P)-dependent dehydrogenase (short-subunit alcohol dehydrogenase family)